MNKFLEQYKQFLESGYETNKAYAIVCERISANGTFDDLVIVTETHRRASIDELAREINEFLIEAKEEKENERFTTAV